MIWTGPIGYRVTRLTRRLIGFGVVVAGWSIMFLPVSTNRFGLGREACGTSWAALFAPTNNTDYECGQAAFPYLWIAGAVFAVGMGAAFWDERRNRIPGVLALVGLALLLALLIMAAGILAGQGMGGE